MKKCSTWNLFEKGPTFTGIPVVLGSFFLNCGFYKAAGYEIMRSKVFQKKKGEDEG